MGRIRTVKPELFTHEDLFEAEKETGLPLRIAFVGLFTCADREGRFKWRPRTLKLAVLPHDEVDFSRVLHALLTRGFIVKYASETGEEIGLIPAFTKHQVINNREAASDLPPPPENLDLTGLPTREARVDARVDDALPTPAQGKGKEGKGREGEEPTEAKASDADASPDPKSVIWKLGVQLLKSAGDSEATARSFLGKHAKGDETKLAEVIGHLAANPKIEPKAYIAKAMAPEKQELAF